MKYFFDIYTLNLPTFNFTIMTLVLKTTKYYIEKAIKMYPKKLDMSEFIEYTNFPINLEIANSFYTQMKYDIPIYLGKYEIEFLGYEGELKKQKENIIDKLKSSLYLKEKNISWWIYDNNKYKEFIESLTTDSIKQVYPPLKNGKGTGRINHIIIMPRIYKHLCMSVETKKSYQIRDYLFYLEELVKCMIEYSKKFNDMTSKIIVSEKQCKIDNLLLEIKETNIILKENEKKAEERFQEERKKADEERKKADDRFNRLLGVAEDTKEEVLEKISELAETRLDLTNVVHDRVSTKRVPNNRYEYLVILKDADDLSMPYYVLRTQRKSVSRRITSIQKDYNVEEVFRIYTPNSTKAWLSICDKFSAKIRKSPTPNWFALRNITEQEFKNYILAMDESERKNPKFI